MLHNLLACWKQCLDLITLFPRNPFAARTVLSGGNCVPLKHFYSLLCCPAVSVLWERLRVSHGFFLSARSLRQLSARSRPTQASAGPQGLKGRWEWPDMRKWSVAYFLPTLVQIRILLFGKAVFYPSLSSFPLCFWAPQKNPPSSQTSAGLVGWTCWKKWLGLKSISHSLPHTPNTVKAQITTHLPQISPWHCRMYCFLPKWTDVLHLRCCMCYILRLLHLAMPRPFCPFLWNLWGMKFAEC